MTRAVRPPLHRTALLDDLYALWTKLVAEPTVPHLDRWLARELGDLERLRRPQRLWLGEQLTAGVRFAALALFGHRAGVALSREFELWRQPPPAAPSIWSCLREVPPSAFFFWVFLRCRHDGAQLPRLDEPTPGAMKAWSALRARCDQGLDGPARLLWAGLPPWLDSLVDERARTSSWSHEELRAFVARQSSRPPLWLRLNRPERAPDVLHELRQHGFAVQRQDDALAVTGERGVYELQAVQGGDVEVQDLASQAIGQVLAVEPGHFVWDCCAGGGGKSLQAAAAMGGRGAVYATDINPARLQDLRRRAQRAGFSSIRAHAWDGSALPEFGATIARRGGFDRVLVDAPCSGSGTWRRNPDGRLRFLPAELPALAATQLALLRVAAAAVKPGGLLVYATCSWLRAENETLIEALLAEAPGLALRSVGIHGNPADDADTTFTAVLARGTRT